MSGLHPFHIDEPPLRVGPPRIRFSATEVLHLAGAVALLTVCFTVARSWTPNILANLVPDPLVLLGSAVAVGTGFTLHELAHKVVAQRYGHWAEFRAQFLNLLGSLALVLFTGFLFATPGAVLIQGRVTPRENGIISLVGPAVNFALAALLWPFTWVTDTGTPVQKVLGVVVFANALLCLFNLLPFGPLDGKKVLRWNGLVYGLAVVLSALLLLGVWVGPDTLLRLVRA